MSKRTFEQSHSEKEIAQNVPDVGDEQPSKRSKIPCYVLNGKTKIPFDPACIELSAKAPDKYGNRPMSIRYSVTRYDQDGNAEKYSIPLKIQTPELNIPFKPSTKADFDAKNGGTAQGIADSNNDYGKKTFALAFSSPVQTELRKEELDFMENFLIPYDNFMQDTAFANCKEWFKTHPSKALFKDKNTAVGILCKRMSDSSESKSGSINPPKIKTSMNKATSCFNAERVEIPQEEITGGCRAKAILLFEDLFYSNQVGLITRAKCLQLQKTGEGSACAGFSFVDDYDEEEEKRKQKEKEEAEKAEFVSSDVEQNEMPVLE